jgi:hypothetical protein
MHAFAWTSLPVSALTGTDPLLLTGIDPASAHGFVVSPTVLRRAERPSRRTHPGGGRDGQAGPFPRGTAERSNDGLADVLEHH